MADTTPPPRLSFAFSIVRQSTGKKQKELAEAAGLTPGMVSKLESGAETLTPEHAVELLATIGVEPERLDVGLFCATLLLLAQSLPASPVEPSAAVLRRIEVAAAKAGRVAYETAFSEYVREARAAQAEEDRRQAARLWERLKARPAEARLALVEEDPRFQTWALAERLCAESVRAAAGEPKVAVELAELALRVAERVAGAAAWRSLLAGYAWAFLGNARRVASDLPGAEDAFRLAWTLWKEGAVADVGVLDGSRLYDLEASLLRAQRKIAAALERMDQALALRPAGERRGQILLNKGTILEKSGSYEEAVKAFEEAAHWIDRDREPRDFFGLCFNLNVCRCHASRFAEAEAGLSELRALKAPAEQDRLKLRWLEGRVDAGFGRSARAMEALSAVRAAFRRLENSYSEALVSLELAALYLEQGRTAEVKTLVGQMERIFLDQGVHEEARKALELFRQAVELETVTLALVRSLVAYLYRAWHDPELCFEA
ncbi:MAG TPA: helix-turn-helix transcriptional regulator [Thermoanaerobaculia bacterium]|jgi:tetratricopeptide (TPR) repeat protein|nr:helix-turn-helix transcriptional regulator [Thermoanaerobaculia bacterium]